ncbi:conserved Plasmodium protein, unknown function [Plasmodium knowlesi strain H]|uniref:CLASP N-terminal domain-containing protein n=3 Tax=Plasmodium knowlesi TaxID=5850 RepID=A0A5K1TTZ1_PLAKH|nr:CLASP domain-containing protein, putative [Plasmodium knowlesi strain H]OTN65680.1 Uncharacterized protein PKNOH_S110103900 [Plasmodium knowlesi]CAA9989658.1 CLASP domain-containing protein, putative [Plasmodium knowlesi strain H]SBO22774.1 conserved Plasmodium protein, unknown function [Plasmodium knowlesi strain H]SBO23127.1 conserved Plasmodium protein, unknown function [Plasmodium knowlesi strain H]VVS79132.1 CLASP domain-containing protein, putative [Plasmodium knowlesi strain H]|eukprot:XP_002260382.1 hypothetical protein, conserved in Plasmodium species [Plasmodium knowlesi strain H]
MPTIGENKYRDNTSTFIDDARNYKRKSIDEHDDCSFFEDLLYLNQERRDSQNVQNDNLFVNVELGSTRTSAIGLNTVKNISYAESKIKESRSARNYQNCGTPGELSLESPLNEIQRYQLTLLKNSNPACPKAPKVSITRDNREGEIRTKDNSIETKFKIGSDEAKIGISLKENIQPLSNSTQGKMQERHLLIKPRRNYNEVHANEMDESNGNNQNVHRANEEISGGKEDALISGSHLSNGYRIPAFVELKKGDRINQPNRTFQYEGEEKKITPPNNRSAKETLKNGYFPKGAMSEWTDEAVLCDKRSSQIGERKNKEIHNSMGELAFKKSGLTRRGDLFENYSYAMGDESTNIDETKDANEANKGNGKKNPTEGFVDHRREPTRDALMKCQRMDDHCVIYKRERHGEKKVLEEEHANEEVPARQFGRKGSNNFNPEVDANEEITCRKEIKITQKNEPTNSILHISNRSAKNLQKPVNVKANIALVNHEKNITSKLTVPDKPIPHEKEANSVSRNNTPNKHTSKSIPKNVNISSKIKNDKSVTYLTYEDITDFKFEVTIDAIHDMIGKLLEITKDQEWTKQIENLINLRKILKFYHKLFFDNHTKELRKITRSIIELLNSPRSCVSKNALLCLSEFYSIGKKRMDCTLDDVILPCLKKAHQTSTDFLSSAANNALLAICNSCTESKLILHFVKIITSKQKTYNLICLKCLIAVIIKFEDSISKFKEINKLIEALVECTAEGSAEMKCTARVALVVLDNICPIKQNGNKFHIPADKIKKIEGLTDRTSESEIDSVLGKIKFS